MFHFIREREEDEVLKIYKLSPTLFRCDFYPSDIRAKYTFKVTRNILIDYISNTLRLVSNDDMDPYDMVQVSTMIHPRILFHVSDLSKTDTYDRLWSMILSSVDIHAMKNGLSANDVHRSNADTERVQNFQRYFHRSVEEDSDG
jgi:hypothetical protein